MRDSLNKVLLTVSPFRSSFLPRFRVYSRNRLFLPSYAPRGANISPALSTLRILPVATGVYRIPSAVRRSLSPPPSPLESTLTKVYQNKRLQPGLYLSRKQCASICVLCLAIGGGLHGGKFSGAEPWRSL